MGFQFVLLGLMVLMAFCVTVILLSTFVFKAYYWLKEVAKDTLEERSRLRRLEEDRMRFHRQYGD